MIKCIYLMLTSKAGTGFWRVALAVRAITVMALLMGQERVSLAATISSSPSSTEASQRMLKELPANGIRNAVFGVHADQIKSVSFTRIGTGVTIPPDDATVPIVAPNLSVTITDPTVIARYLRALHHAMYIPSVSAEAGPATLELAFRKSGSAKRPNIYLEVNRYYFGPEFQREFRQLPCLLAKQARHEARAAGDNVIAINMVGRHVTNSKEIRLIVAALKHVGEPAFEVKDDMRSAMEIILVLNTGQVSTIDLAPHSATLASLSSSVLLKYYKAVLREQQRRFALTVPPIHDPASFVK